MKKIDWAEVETLLKPVPSYEDLIKRLSDIYSYEFVQAHYRQTMDQADTYAVRLLGSDPRHRYGPWLKELQATFWQLGGMGIKDTLDLIDTVATRDSLESFYAHADHVTPAQIIGVLKYLLYWVLPGNLYLRDLVNPSDEAALAHTKTLRENGVRFTLDLLQKGRTPRGRADLAAMTGVPEVFIANLAHRADFTRMPWVSGATVRHYFNAGIDSLDKLAGMDPAALDQQMRAYFLSFRSKGQHAVEWDSGHAIAGVLPKLIES